MRDTILFDKDGSRVSSESLQSRHAPRLIESATHLFAGSLLVQHCADKDRHHSLGHPVHSIAFASALSHRILRPVLLSAHLKTNSTSRSGSTVATLHAIYRKCGWFATHSCLWMGGKEVEKEPPAARCITEAFLLHV